MELFVDVDSTATSRYDIGIWISTDGDPNGDGSESGQCAAISIATGLNGLDDGNYCGDVQDTGSPDLTNVSLGTLTFVCTDDDADGFLDVPIITTWSQNAGGVCTTATQTVPGSPSKCKNNPTFQIPVPVPGQIIIEKQTTPDGATESFSFSLEGNSITESFSLMDNEMRSSGIDGVALLASTYTITESAMPAGWSFSSFNCTSTEGTSTFASTMT